MSNYRPTYEEVSARVGTARVRLTEGQLALCINGVAEIYQKNILKMDENHRAGKTEFARRHEEIAEHCRELWKMLEGVSSEWSARFNAVEREMIARHKREARREAASKAAATRAAKKLQK